MKLWAISDLHFSHDGSKTMDQFGKIWSDHPDKISVNWRKTVKSKDLVLVAGDISWARKGVDALKDLNKIDRLPGDKKIIVRGNHDHWWKGYDKLVKSVPESIIPLAGNAVKVNDEVFCGTMGWLAPNDPCSDPLDAKFFNRELEELKKALDHALELKPENGINLLLHFPPFTTQGKETAFSKLIAEYPVTNCVFGHFHFPEEWEAVPQGIVGSCNFLLTSTDYLEHQPKLVKS